MVAYSVINLKSNPVSLFKADIKSVTDIYQRLDQNVIKINGYRITRIFHQNIPNFFLYIRILLRTGERNFVKQRENSHTLQSMSEALNRDYCVCEEIGRGRFGVVFRCYSSVSGDSFAVKSIDKSLISEDSIDRQCIYNEAKIMQILSPNPNVLQIFDVYEDETHLHIVLEFCNSSDLFCRVTERVFSESEAVTVMVLFCVRFIKSTKVEDERFCF